MWGVTVSEYDLTYYQKETSELSKEIERKLVMVGLDWSDEGLMRDLAREVLSGSVRMGMGENETNREKAARVELFGLIGLMNKVMCEAAEHGTVVHGSDAWKAIAKALWAERAIQGDKASAV